MAPVRIALLTEGGYPFAQGESAPWCDRLLRGLTDHDFEVRALSRSSRQARGPRLEPPPHVLRVHTIPLWGPPPEGRPPARRLSRRFAESFAELAAALCTSGPGDPGGRDGDGARLADRFATGLYGLAGLAAERGGLSAWLRSEAAVRVLEAACRRPGAPRAVHTARITDLLTVADHLERALRPLAPGPGGAGGVPDADVCHALGAGPAALPGLLAHHRSGTPLLLTEHGVRLREHYLLSAAGGAVRALLTAFRTRLAREAYARAALIVPGSAHVRRWQQRCGADPERQRTVYPGLDHHPFHAVGEAELSPGTPPAGGRTLVWAGRIEPAKDLAGLLLAFREVRRAVPGARLRIVAVPGPHDTAYAAHCRALAARLFPAFPGLAAAPPSPGGADSDPVSFEQLGGPAVPTLADAYASGDIAVLSSVSEGLPASLIEAMFCGRATVSTDTGAVCEAVGGTGLVVPPCDPVALAEACLALLRDPGRRARLGAAARARALELFTADRSSAAYRSLYRELVSACPAPPRGHGPGAVAPAGRPAASPAGDASPRWAGPPISRPSRPGAVVPGGDTP